MRSSDSLFQLIKSLSQSEKRFFKLEAAKYSRKEQNDYLLLYEQLDKLEYYDEEQFKASLKDKKMLSRLSSTKNYLFNLIVKTLTQYHAERNSHQQISTLLQQVDILFSKGLYKSAKKLLNKAKKIADDYCRLSYQILISEWEHRFADLEDKFWKTEKKMSEIQKQEHQQLEALSLKLRLERLHEEAVTLMYTSGMPRTEEEKQVFVNYLQDPIMQEAAQEGQPYYIKNIYYSLAGLCSYMSFDKDAALHYARERFEMFENYEHLLIEDSHEFAISAFNYLQILTTLRLTDIALVQLNKILNYWEHPKILLEERSKEFFLLIKYYHSTNIYLNLNHFDKVLSIGEDFKTLHQGVLEGEERKNRLFFVIPVNLSIAAFVLERYDDALYWLRIVLNDNTNTIRLDTLGLARLLHLIVQYELDNRSIIEHYIESTQRFFIEQEKFTDFERIFIRLMKQIAYKSKWDKGFTELFAKAKKELMPYVSGDSYEKMFLEHYHILDWLDSKIEGKKFLALVLSNSQKKL